jgi:hypothetical protein
MLLPLPTYIFLTFNPRCTIPPVGWLAKGKDADWIKSRRTMNRRNQRMKKPSTSEGVLIKWAANDPVLHSFRPEEKDRDGNVINQGLPQTVAGYFKERYAIT